MKTPYKPFIRKVRVPLYRNSLWIVIDKNITKAMDFVEDLTSEKIHPNPRGSAQAMVYTYYDEEKRFKLILFLKPTAKPGEIAHEVKHVLNSIFSNAGMRLSVTNDEMECYYLEKLINMVHDTIKLAKKTKETLAPNEIIV